MLGGIHFFVASSLASSSTNNYFASLIIGIASHHILDKLPHLDINIFKKKYNTISDLDFKFFALVIPEFVLFLLLSFYFIGNLPLEKQKIAFVGGLGSILPDILNFANIIIFKGKLNKFKLFEKYQKFHHDFHFKYQGSKITPIFIQILIVLLAIILFEGLI